MLAKYLYYLKWGFRTLVHKEKIPLNSSIILTDECNLDCRHCIVSNLGYSRQSLYEVEKDIRVLYETGARVLVITGGEPFIWKDQEGNTVEDVVSTAKNMGFFRVVVCTNGTCSLESSADYLWVSLDGSEDKHNFIRGSTYSHVVENITRSRHKGIHINFTISSNNLGSFPAVAENILAIPNVKGILFHLYTKYLGGSESLVLEAEERQQALRNLRNFKFRHPFAVFNTFSGIAALTKDNWARNTYASVTINRGILSECCCRIGIYDEDVCRHCGCTPAVETWVLQTFKPSAIIENIKYI
ncbi:MAG: radical SAM protein [Geobacter sp.]|nr:MAG: radical SAM protein [Geobacter sp.]